MLVLHIMAMWWWWCLLLSSFLPPAEAQAPVISGVESRAKTYYYNGYPPGNPAVRVTRTIVVTQSSNLRISSAMVVIKNGTKLDLLEADNLGKSIQYTYNGQDGDCQMYLYGNATARAYQRALRYIWYTAPLKYKKSESSTTHMWRNVTFQVTNELGEGSNVETRAMVLDTPKKAWTETFQGSLDDIGEVFIF